MDLLKKQLQEHLTPATINKLVDSACKDYNYLVNWITEIDKECKYQMELMRTFISQAKEMNRNANYSSMQNKQP